MEEFFTRREEESLKDLNKYPLSIDGRTILSHDTPQRGGATHPDIKEDK